MLYAIIAILLLTNGYLLFKLKPHEIKENREQKDKRIREEKHYTNVFSFNATKAYGGK